MQFNEPKSKKGKCPICGKPVTIRSIRDAVVYCSRVCASQDIYQERYRGTNSGPMDRPSKLKKTKF